MWRSGGSSPAQTRRSQQHFTQHPGQTVAMISPTYFTSDGAATGQRRCGVQCINLAIGRGRYWDKLGARTLHAGSFMHICSGRRRSYISIVLRRQTPHQTAAKISRTEYFRRKEYKAERSSRRTVDYELCRLVFGQPRVCSLVCCIAQYGISQECRNCANFFIVQNRFSRCLR